MPFRPIPDDELTRRGFLLFYNMDYQGAIDIFREEEKLRPDNPFVVNHLLAAVLAKELEREGALDATLYMGNRFLKLKAPPVNAEVKKEISDLSQRSLMLANQELNKNPDDVHALYARGVARGLAAVYSAVIEKKWLGALRSGLGAYHDHEHVLKLDPDYSDAKLIVGAYQYIVGSLPWWQKTLVFLLDIHGSKSKGLRLLKEAENGYGEASIDAGTIRALFLARDKEYPKAIAIMKQDYTDFPHNFIFGLAEADLLNASGQRDAAMDAYRDLLHLGQQGFFPGARVERAAYALGVALSREKQYVSAASAFDAAMNYPRANEGVVIGAALKAGEMYDRIGERDKALARYNKVLQLAPPNSAPFQSARRYLKHPYRGQ